MSENIPDLDKVRQERIQKISHLVTELANEHLHAHYNNLTTVWIKNDSLRQLEFSAGGFDYLATDDSAKALDEIYDLLVQSPELSGMQYTSKRTTTGIVLIRSSDS